MTDDITFDHVVEPWVREPPGDYHLDDDPGYDGICDRADVPMMVVIGGTIASWSDAEQTFIREPYVLEDGKVVARSDGC